VKGYLQRLYDRAGAVPLAAAPSLGTPRSQSPLVEADQRLAMPEFSRNFALGAPPEAPEAEAPIGASPEAEIGDETPRRTAPPAPRRQLTEVAPAVPVAAAPDAALPIGEPRTGAPDPVVARPEPRAVTPPLPEIVRQALAEATHHAAPPEPAIRPERAGAEVVPLTPQAPAQARHSPVAPDDPAQWLPLAEPRPPIVPLEIAQSPVEMAPEPVVPVVSIVPEAPFQPTPLLPPAPAPLAPLLPDPASIDWDRIEARIAELVAGHAVPPSGKAAGPASAPAQPKPAPAAAPAPARPRTAEAASVIGRIERPARYTRLFGARLR